METKEKKAIRRQKRLSRNESKLPFESNQRKALIERMETTQKDRRENRFLHRLPGCKRGRRPVAARDRDGGSAGHSRQIQEQRETRKPQGVKRECSAFHEEKKSWKEIQMKTEKLWLSRTEMNSRETDPTKNGSAAFWRLKLRLKQEKGKRQNKNGQETREKDTVKETEKARKQKEERKVVQLKPVEVVQELQQLPSQFGMRKGE
uniref:Putative non-specific serine/threonine protein kinase n=1 Tax=Toxoplasma gondii COUG TaxID=1074873 RepID=A0A2G8XV48_TOXGO|nr:putative non-specific serine/threonine protein kinase [Toxoplasma gondii COUG]